MAKYTRLPHSELVPLSSHPDGALLELEDDYSSPTPRRAAADEGGSLPSYLIWISAILVCLNTLVAVLVPFTPLYSPSPLSIGELDKLPYPDQHLGLDRIADTLLPHYHYAWPTKIVRISQKLQGAVYGDGVQVFISVEVRISYLCHTR
jgi:hypothetical protein